MRNYPGRTQSDAAAWFAADATEMAQHGYHPVAQSWAEGRPGVARMLTIGLYSLAARPNGVLTVTYRKEAASLAPAPEKVCPRCAETIKAAALVCRYCGHEFDQGR